MRMLGRLFNAFPRIVQFPGTVQSAPEDFDVTAPVVPVWDVHRDGELSRIQTDRQAGGFFQAGVDNVHVGAGDVIAGQIAIYTQPPLNASWMSHGDRWVWLYWFGPTGNINMHATNPSALSIGIPALGSALATRDILLGAYLSSGAATITPTSTLGNGFFPVTQGPAHAMPMLIPPGPDASSSGTLNWRSVSNAGAGAGTIRMSTICWVGPIGVYPPGMS